MNAAMAWSVEMPAPVVMIEDTLVADNVYEDLLGVTFWKTSSKQTHMLVVKLETSTQEAKSEPSSQLATDTSMQAILAYLRKHNLADTENKLKEELKKREAASATPIQPSDPEVGNVLATYRSDGDPSSYESAYR